MYAKIIFICILYSAEWSEAKATWFQFWLQLIVAIFGGALLNNHFRWFHRLIHFISAIFGSTHVKWKPTFHEKENSISLGIKNYSGKHAKDNIYVLNPKYILFNKNYLSDVEMGFNRFEKNNYENNQFDIVNPYIIFPSSSFITKRVTHQYFNINGDNKCKPISISKELINESFQWGEKNVNRNINHNMDYIHGILFIFFDKDTRLEKVILIDRNYRNFINND